MTNTQIKTAVEQTPYLDFYREHGVSPVAQDISDLQKHFQRRESLYLALGIPPVGVRGMTVLELGPGSGYNAIYTQSLQPRAYTLVEGNPTGLAATQALMRLHHPASDTIAYHGSTIEAWQTTQTFDFIICEGLIPYQNEPIAFARNLRRFAHPGSIIIMTTCDAVSTIGEFVRRLFADAIIARTAPFNDRLARLRPFFARHLAALSGVSRPADDWIIDNIIQPLQGKPFSIADAITAMADGGADFHGSSPQFLRDWRWYKNLHGAERFVRDVATTQFFENNLNLLDYRMTFAPHSAAFGRTLDERAKAFMRATQRYEIGDVAAGDEALLRLAAIADHISALAPQTAQALLAAQAAISAARNGTTIDDSAFYDYFGRGQQNVSFVVRA